jgi:hypothetical protein
MANAITQFKTIDNNNQNLSSGRIYNVFGTITFLTGETTKYLTLSIPENLTLNLINMGIRFNSNFDNTVAIDLYENPTGLTNGVALTTQNMNRNYFATPFPSLFYIFNSTGSITSYDAYLDNFKVIERNCQCKTASNYTQQNLQRIKGSDIDYAYVISRTTDTATLSLDINILVVQSI